jgi:preprotein translocase subunit SecG
MKGRFLISIAVLLVLFEYTATAQIPGTLQIGTTNGMATVSSQNSWHPIFKSRKQRIFQRTIKMLFVVLLFASLFFCVPKLSQGTTQDDFVDHRSNFYNCIAVSGV